jgi:hypothetical protein
VTTVNPLDKPVFILKPDEESYKPEEAKGKLIVKPVQVSSKPEESEGKLIFKPVVLASNPELVGIFTDNILDDDFSNYVLFIPSI